jgi:hypothetical protein
MMRWLTAVVLGGVILMGCKEELQAQEPWQEALAGKPQAIPATRSLGAEDEAVKQQFGPVCRELLQLEGMRFKDARSAYLCRAYHERDKNEAALLKLFPKEKIEEADILTRIGFMGKEFAAVVLTDTQNKPDAVVLRMTVLKPLLVALESAEAAAAWAQLMGAAAAGPGAQGFASATITPGKTGWKFENVESFTNCHPVSLLSLEVARQGKITELARKDKVNPDGTMSVVCVD